MGNNGNLLLNDVGGNVGIGTVGPNYKLDVNGSAQIRTNTNKNILFSELTSMPNMPSFTIGDGSIGFSRTGDGASNIAGIGMFNDANLFLGAYSDIVFGSGAANGFNYAPERMRIASGGNVGIGTPTPTNPLTVVSNSAGLSTAWASNTNASGISVMGYNGSTGTYGQLGAGSYAGIFMNGNVGIGIASPSYRLDVLGAASTWSAHIGSNDGTSHAYLGHSSYAVFGQNSTAGATTARFDSSGSGGLALSAVSVSSNGNGLVGQNSAAGYYCYLGTPNYSILCIGPTSGVSDRRLKKDIRPLEAKEGLSAIMRLEPVHYRWKDERMNKAHPGGEIGFVAQNVETVLPDLVSESPQAKDAPLKLEDGLQKGLQYDRLAAPLVKAVQELKADNDNLRAVNDNEAAQIKTLTARLDALEAARR
jgi:hypothetical protein